MNASDVINFSISTLASKTADATFFKKKLFIPITHASTRWLSNDPALIKMLMDYIAILMCHKIPIPFPYSNRPFF